MQWVSRARCKVVQQAVNRSIFVRGGVSSEDCSASVSNRETCPCLLEQRSGLIRTRAAATCTASRVYGQSSLIGDPPFDGGTVLIFHCLLMEMLEFVGDSVDRSVICRYTVYTAA